MFEQGILSRCRNMKLPVIIYTMNGYQIKGTIIEFSDTVIVVLTETGKKQMVYKHGISTIDVGE